MLKKNSVVVQLLYMMYDVCYRYLAILNKVAFNEQDSDFSRTDILFIECCWNNKNI